MDYRNGRADYHRGVSINNAPYSDNSRRIPWVKGWSDSKRDYLENLERLGLTHCDLKSLGLRDFRDEC